MKNWYETETDIITKLHGTHAGHIKYQDKEVVALLEIKEKSCLLKIDDIIDLSLNEYKCVFTSEVIHAQIIASITSHRSSIQVKDKLISRYSEGKIDSLLDNGWKSDNRLFRSYFRCNQAKLLYELCGNPSLLKLTINQSPIKVHQLGNYLIIENEDKVDFDSFTEIRYNILVAIGFVTGFFIQDEAYTFQNESDEEAASPAFQYEKLRKGYSSIYHAMTDNPFSYSHLLGDAIAGNLYHDKTLKCLDGESLSKLSELIHNNQQIKYALVLFNEANGNDLSLLIKNNCFFVVLEVLKKYFHDTFKEELLNDYSTKGNMDKFRLVFELIVPISNEELSTISKRNTFMHGDIKYLEGHEMLSIMQKQITFIYKCVLTFVEFDGSIIDHFAIRNNQPEKAFIKLIKPIRS